jgi:LPPG:FO 2-phospho-L-lactate transferase
MITILSGGTGTPKLLQGIKNIKKPKELTVIVNTLENDYFSGVYVAADLDTVMYTLADIINEDTWYGIKDDTFITHETLKNLGCPETLRIGDKDRAFKIQKTLLLKEYSLSQVIEMQKKSIGLDSKIIPMSDQKSDIIIHTDEGEMEFHQFLVDHQGQPEVLDVEYTIVKPANDVVESIEGSDMVIIGPSNPITSIGPITSMEGIVDALKKTYVVAVSPIIGDKPVSGPAEKFMQAFGHEVSSLGVANIYKEFLDKFIIDNIDISYQKKIERLISEVVVTKTNMENLRDKVKLASIILG